MANINKIAVGGIEYNITIPSGLTEEEQAQIRENIGALSKAASDFQPDGTYPDLTVGSAGNAESADALTTARAIDGVVFNGTTDITHYGTCPTEANTGAKTVSLTGFSLVVGAKIAVKFTNANTVNSPTLNVNSTGAKPIIADGDTVYVKWLAGALMEFVYDGTYWVCVAGYQLAGKRVGHIECSAEATSPAELFGGSWAPIKDKFILAAGDTYAAGSTGGEATHTLTIDEMPSHRHTLNVPDLTGIQQVLGGYWQEYSSKGQGTDPTGGNQPHNNMPPYIAKYVWERIS